MNVAAPIGCPWTAASSVPWVAITSGSSGISSGTVSYSVASNQGSDDRSGTLTVAMEMFSINQSGAGSERFLNFPLRNKTAFTVKINSIFRSTTR